jgi:signal recognition particle subunit SEC65
MRRRGRCVRRGVAVSTTVAASPSTAELETVAVELGGEYDGSETAIA